MIKILVVEDEPITNQMVCSLLEQLRPCKVVAAFDGQEAIDILMEETFQLVITDIVMPEVDGFELIEYMNDVKLKTPVVVLTSLSGEKDLIKGYNYPIEDYLLKPIKVDIWKARINNILKKLYPMDDSVRLDSDNLSVVIGEDIVTLTRNEFQIFEYLYSRNGKVCNKLEMFDYFWGVESDLSERVVDDTIRRIRKKLDGYQYLIKTKSGVGYYYENTK